MFEEARAIRTLMDMRGVTRREIAKSMGVSESCISNKLRLLGFSPEVEKKITASGIGERQARALLRLGDKEKQLYAIELIKERSLTASEAEALTDLIRTEDMAKRVGMLNKTKAKEGFMSAISESIHSLSAMGINVSKRVSHYGKKTYITIAIEED